MNKIFLSGNLTKAPEVRYTPNGKAVVKTGIAVQRPYKNPQGQYDVDFFNLTAWDKTAEFCGKYFHKGSRVFVEGRLNTYSYTGQDGVKRFGVDVQVENIEFGGDKRGQSEESEQTKKPPQNENSDDEFIGDEIPDYRVPFH